MQTKYYCFTVNNYTEADILCLEADNPEVSYIVFGYEIAPTTGTPHLQGYVEFNSRKRMRQAVRILGGRASVRVRNGTALQAANYCKKDNNRYFERGNISTVTQGTRTDLEEARDALQRRTPIRDFADDHFAFFVRYQRGLQAYRSLYSEKRRWETEVIVRWGATGTGKTKSVHDEIKDEELYIHPGDRWFDGYDGEDNVLFDDFTGGVFPIAQLLKLLDRYPMSVPIKGGFVNWKPRRVFITSNLDPREWYSGANPEHQAALRRRFTSITHYNEPL